MNWIENLLIIAGVSLDIFTEMECRGSLVSKINKRQLSLICGIMVVSQLVALYVGFVVSNIYCKAYPSSDGPFLGEILAMAIMVCLGGRLVAKAIKRERVDERLENNVNVRKLLHRVGVLFIYTFLAGIAFGFLETSLPIILIMNVITVILFVIGGMYTGYRIGFEFKTKVYIMGSALLVMAAIDILVRYILELI